MLGHSNAGKTTYIALMYKVLNKPHGGFSLRSTDTGAHNSLIRAADNVLKNRYPPATDQRAQYSMVLQHKGSDVFPFTWADYRGGALGEYTDSPQAKQLHEDLKQADGIVVFIDAQRQLVEPEALGEIRLLVTHVIRALSERPQDVPVPLTLVFTKTDLIKWNAAHRAMLYEPFEPLLGAIRASGTVHGAIIPVACGSKPSNVDRPVLRTLQYGIAGTIVKLAQEVKHYEERAAYHDRNDTVGDRIVKWWRSETPHWKLAEQNKARAQERLVEAQKLQAPAKRLDRLLRGIDTF